MLMLFEAVFCYSPLISLEGTWFGSDNLSKTQITFCNEYLIKRQHVLKPAACHDERMTIVMLSHQYIDTSREDDISVTPYVITPDCQNQKLY